MRQEFSIIFILLVLALSVCAFLSYRSSKKIGPSVSLLLCGLIPPVIGNLIIISSSVRFISTLGCYIYFLGMDLAIYSLLRFTFDYCLIRWPNTGLKIFVYAFFVIDVIQLLLNPLFHHAFTTEAIIVDAEPYYRLVPYLGQTFHRVVDYAVFLAVIIIFIYKMIHTPRVYVERYSIILAVMLFTGAWETYYIFSRTPVDTSMIGFGVFGLLVFYFSMYYRPLKLLDRMLAGIASQIPEALFFYDDAGRCIWANEPGLKLTGIKDTDFEKAKDRLAELFGDFEQDSDEWTLKRSQKVDDEMRYYIMEKHTVKDSRDYSSGSFLSIKDNTEEQNALQKEKYNATHDRLTDLYTKEHLYECIHRLLLNDQKTDFLIIMIDVKDFKIINDIFGSEFGDYTLKQIAEWIKGMMPQKSVYGRLSGDMFGVCIPKDEFDAEKLEKALSQFVVRNDNIEHHILVHLGVYEVNEPKLDVSVMFDRAHMALSTIKDDYQTHIAWYDDKMRERVLWDQHISTQLRRAIYEKQVRPYLQPIVDTEGRIVGAEALVRWIHPVDGFLSPGMFIPVFEKNGMIAELDKYIWRCACKLLYSWKKEHSDLFISINISPKDFYFIDVAAEIKKIVKEYDIDPSKLRIEITETVMMTDINNRMKILEELKEAGFMIEMDDFGSGYSSLNMLKDMPVDILKIDMVFLSKSKQNEKAQKIMHNIISMSEDLGIISLTEGIEDEEQFRFLLEMGCKLFQGYYFARPMPVDEFENKYLE